MQPFPQQQQPPPPPQQQPESSSSALSRSRPKSNSTDSAARPVKRARKAVNCEPCRSSKLKCDRGKPCSGCVLRGTVASCYADVDVPPTPLKVERNIEASPSTSNVSPLIQHNAATRLDPRAEISRIRHALSLLESAISGGTASGNESNASSSSVPPREPTSAPLARSSTLPYSEPTPPPRPGQGGLYVGPTSAATALLSFRNDDVTDPTDPFTNGASELTNLDLLSELPRDTNIVDALIHHYFESCTWFYPHLNQPSFAQSWNRVRQSMSSDPIVLSTVFVVMAISLQYLPPSHPILPFLPDSAPVLSDQYYNLSVAALARYKVDKRTPTLELVELLLLRTHYLSICKNDCEEIWTIRSELISAGTAMGLHRDPGKWKMSRELVDRRRWAWWNIMVMERWQAFLFGRPLAIANHHFDTQFPMSDIIDRNVPVSEDPNLPYLASFQLAWLIGDIVDDAVSVRGVPYSRIQEHDRALAKWLENLPQDLNMDEYQLSRALLPNSPLHVRRIAVQSLCIRAQFYHIRLTLHRPYATPQSRQAQTTCQDSNGATAPTHESFDRAITSASRLIHLVTQSSQELISQAAFSIPMHIFWGTSHIFSAAVFFSFQLIWNPSQPFRADIARVIYVLEALQAAGSVPIPLAEKGLRILRALAPLYEEEMDEKRKNECIALVRRLAYPCHDSPVYPRYPSTSPQYLHTPSPLSVGQPPYGVHPPPLHPVAPPIPPQRYADGVTPYPVNSSEEALWSSGLGLDSTEWGRFMNNVLQKPGGSRIGPSNGLP